MTEHEAGRADTALAVAATTRYSDPSLPGLYIEGGNLPATARALAGMLTQRPHLFSRGGQPVRLRPGTPSEGAKLELMNRHTVTLEAHAVCRPFVLKEVKKAEVQVHHTLPERVADLYLGMGEGAGLHPLDGITSAPILDESGAILAGEGYDPGRRLWREKVPPLDVPGEPTHADAEAALKRVRKWLRTFCFADAVTVRAPGHETPVVDLDTRPGMDESAALVAGLTAVCRASLDLAPGVMVSAAAMSGSGAGKGLLIRTFCAIAFGRKPAAVTVGHSPEELDKRVSSAFLSGDETVFLDNVNDTSLKSNVLASVLTECPAKIRPLGRSTEMRVNSKAFVAVTGNALAVGEDLARRFLMVNLDAKVESPEARSFKGDLLKDTAEARPKLLADFLTIWRWGRQQGGALPKGIAASSFGEWARWCRDPLLALGCRDPMERVAAIKAADPRRQEIAEMYAAWWERYEERTLKVSDLAPEVMELIDPRGRQAAARKLSGLVGTIAAGFVLRQVRETSSSSPALYRLQRTREAVAAAPQAISDLIESLL